MSMRNSITFTEPRETPTINPTTVAIDEPEINFCLKDKQMNLKNP